MKNEFLSSNKINIYEKLVRFGIGEDWRGKDIGINTEDTWAPFMVRHYNLDDRYDKYLDNILYLQSFLKIK